MLKEGANLIVNEVTVDKWVYGGDSLARVEGRVLLAPFLIPGETARVETQPHGKQMLRGSNPQVLTASPERTGPPCPYFFRCGGCHYQHARYEFQVAQKTEILREQLRRVGHLEYTGEIRAVSARDLGYRNRTQFHTDGESIGYYEEGTHRLVPIEHCPISAPEINAALAAILEMMRDPRWPRFLRSLELFTNGREVLLNILDSERPLARHFFDWCAERIPNLAGDSLEYEVGPDVFRVGHTSFFQVNRFLVDALAQAATEGAQGATAMDLYSGVGLFSIRLARQFAAVTAVESGRGAVQDLVENARRAGIQVEAVKDNVESYLATVQTTPDFVLADPPRSGVGKRVVRELVRLAPPRIRLVACDPSTLARDVASLAAGGYALTTVTMVDLFPHTYHIEAIANLERC
jgi:23S rRNA (uracil1939-C5)-methyltransferase